MPLPHDVAPPAAQRWAGALALGLASLAALASGAAGAATVTLQPDGHVVVLEGRIDLGDLEKVRKVAAEGAPTTLYLASPGGNLAEAIRIGLFIRARAWETRSAAPDDTPAEIRIANARAIGVRDPVNNDVCASACFFIFVSGIYRDGHALGIHMPYIPPAELEKMPPEAAVRRTDGVKVLVDRYLRRMGVPPKYAAKMLTVPPARMHWLTEDEISSDLHGFAPEVREWAATQCPNDDVNSRACRDTVMFGIRLRALEERSGH